MPLCAPYAGIPGYEIDGKVNGSKATLCICGLIEAPEDSVPANILDSVAYIQYDV